MSCPDWRALCDQRDAHPGEVAGWQAALAHLDDCPDCRRAAPAVDPTLIFRRMPSLEADPGEIEAIQRAVAMRRRESTRRDSRANVRRPLLRAAAVAAVLTGALFLRGAGSPAPEAPQPFPVLAAPAVASEIDLQHMPLVETIDPAYGSIIQVVDDDISLVVVLPAGADVDV